MERTLHDMRNDLAVASETIQAIVDGRSEPNQAMLRQALDALGDAEARLPGLRDALRRGSAGDDLLAAIIEGSPYAKVLVDERGRIALVNAQAERLFGYSRDELLGETLEKLVPERFRPSHPQLRDAFNEAPVARPMGARA